MSVISTDLVRKYNVPGPRYTSYPTVPYWDATPGAQQWIEHLAQSLSAGKARGEGAAVYVHIPFCRSLCTYCGCNVRITRSRSFVAPYLAAVLEEFRMYRERLGSAALPVGELHIGGGTPTYLSAAELAELVDGLLAGMTLAAGASLSLEVDPRTTDAEQLRVLAQRGFRRVSLGVQDFDPRVQDIVNRVQTEEQVATVTETARAYGFESVNYDLIYGLPLQTLASIERTLDAVERLRPDRIAFYSYAHVPWIRPSQRRFTEADLPTGAERRALYELGRERLERAGYREVGLDHFALPTDSLWRALESGTLHRNFMGYTDTFTVPLIGLGLSAIGDAVTAFAQNEKELNRYQERVLSGELPLHRGHLLDREDQILRQHILNLMTRFHTEWRSPGAQTPFLDSVQQRLEPLAADAVVELADASCRVTEPGRAFVRNVCMAFDARLMRRAPTTALFSSTV
jgi:oxygen-independent coproporphyrinogen-3 oxidase